MKWIIFLFNLLTLSLRAAEYEEGIILIKFKENASSFQNKINFAINYQEEIKLEYGIIKIFRVHPLLKDKKSFFALIKKLNEDPNVEIASPNFYYYPLDANFNLQWGLNNDGSFIVREGVNGKIGADINAISAWDITPSNRKIKVAVIDTGIDYRHPDLKNQIWVNQKEANGSRGVDDDGNGLVDDIYGYDFANKDSDPYDDHGHGTHVAGIIGASHNEIGVKGILKNVSLIPIKYMPNNGPGKTENAIRSVDYAIKMNAQIINASWGGGNFDPLLLEAIKYADQKGVLFVAAAGNTGENNDEKAHYPSDYDSPNVISVGATDALDSLTLQSNYGPGKVDVVAPGDRIFSTLPKNQYFFMTGTSASAAFVTGVAGLFLSKENISSAADLKRRIISTSVELDNLRNKIKMGGGRVDAYNLLKNIRPPKISGANLVWETVSIGSFESAHPYTDRTNIVKTFRVPGAKFIKVVVEEFEIEKRWDFLELTSPDGSIVDRISGKGENYISNFVKGDSITVHFLSDFINTRWGFLIKEVQVVR